MPAEMSQLKHWVSAEPEQVLQEEWQGSHWLESEFKKTLSSEQLPQRPVEVYLKVPGWQVVQELPEQEAQDAWQFKHWVPEMYSSGWVHKTQVFEESK